MKLINVSNHPSTQWDDAQKRGWNTIIDVPFPQVPANCSRDDILRLRDELVSQIEQLSGFVPDECDCDEMGRISDECWHEEHGIGDGFKLHCAGAFVLAHAVQQIFDGSLVFPMSERNTVINPDGSKTVRFQFVQWIVGL